MGDPEFRNDENILLRTMGVYVKSIPFEGILTTKRIILVDRAKNLLPPKEIPLATIKSAEAGENAIRDQILTLAVMAKTGDTRQMILTFSRQEGGNRIKERDEWLRLIKANLGASFENVIRKVIPGADAAPARQSSPQPRITVVSSPVPPAPQQQAPAPAYPEPAPVPPVQTGYQPVVSPVVQAPAAAPQGEFAFCTRCGNKVPADSAFCNRCGSPIVAPGAAAAPAPAPAQRPIDRDIQTIEPLIERSSEKVPADPLRKPAASLPVQPQVAWDDEEEPAEVSAAPTAASAQPAEAPKEKSGFLPRIFSPKAKTQAPAPAGVIAPPVPSGPRRSFMPGKNILMGIGAVIVILVVLAAGVFVVMPMLSGAGDPSPSGSPDGSSSSSSSSSSSTLNPSGTVVPIAEETTNIPPTGVQVHVNYLGGFQGKYGMPDALTVVPGNSLDRVWEVENATGTVIAEFEKQDGSKHALLVEIYKDGVLLSKDVTTIGHGKVKLSVDVTSGVAATPVSSSSDDVPLSATNTSATATAAPTVSLATTTAITTTAPATNTTTAAP